MTSHGLLVDYGGVLTASVGRSFREFEDSEGLPKGAVFDLLRGAYEADQDTNPIARYERGEIDRATFERGLVQLLGRAGYEVDPDRIVERLFEGMRPGGGMWSVVRQARDSGVRTALLSNSWGSDGYPRQELAGIFDELVISGEVGVRKPDRAMFELAAERLDVPLERCAFVDDLDRNVEAAERLGMRGVLHTGDVAATAAALSDFLGVPLSA